MSTIKEGELTVGEAYALENGYLNFRGHDAVRAFRGHGETADVEDMALFALGQLNIQEPTAWFTTIKVLEKIIFIERSK